MTQIIQHVDNIHFHVDGKEIASAHTLKVVFQIDEGPVERGTLDLTDAHTGEWVEKLRELLRYADDRGDSSMPEVPKRKWPKKPSAASPVRDQGLAASKQYRRKQREWIDANKIRSIDGPDRPAYTTPAGGAYWPHWLDSAYEWFQLTGRVVLPRRPETFSNMYEFRSYIKNWSAEEEEKGTNRVPGVAESLTRPAAQAMRVPAPGGA